MSRCLAWCLPTVTGSVSVSLGARPEPESDHRSRSRDLGPGPGRRGDNHVMMIYCGYHCIVHLRQSVSTKKETFRQPSCRDFNWTHFNKQETFHQIRSYLLLNIILLKSWSNLSSHEDLIKSLDLDLIQLVLWDLYHCTCHWAVTYKTKFSEYWADDKLNIILTQRRLRQPDLHTTTSARLSNIK